MILSILIFVSNCFANTQVPTVRATIVASTVSVKNITGGSLSVSFPSPQGVTGPLTDTQLRASPVPISGSFSVNGSTVGVVPAGTFPVSGPVTDTELRATPVPVSGSLTVSGPLTDTQLRAVPVPVSGPLTDTQLRASPVEITGSVTGPLTDAQIRATPLPVSGSFSANGSTVAIVGLNGAAIPVSGSFSANGSTLAVVNANGGSLSVSVSNTPSVTASVSGAVTVNASTLAVVNSAGASLSVTFPSAQSVTGPLTDTQLRATPVPVSGSFSANGSTLAVVNPVGGSLAVSGSVNATVTGAVTVNNSTLSVVNANGASLSVSFPSAQSVTGPLTDTQLRATAVPVSGSFSANGSTLAVVGLNGLPVRTWESSTLTVTPGTGTWSVAASSLVVNGSTLAVVNANGASLNVNCTGGCGSPTQAITFIAHSTTGFTANRYHFGIMNGAGSAVTVKIQKIRIAQASDVAVTGVVAHFELRRITAFSGGLSTATLVAANLGDTINASITRMSVPTSVTGADTYPPLAQMDLSGEETAIQLPKDLYEFSNTGGKPLTLRAGEGIIVKQSALAVSAGKVSIYIEGTQE